MNHQRQEEFITPQALNMPSLIRDNAEDGGYQKMLDDLATPYVDGAAPSLNLIKDPSVDEEYPTPSSPVEPTEIPTFNMLPDNRNVATKLNLSKDPYVK